jgi:ribosomal protein L11 methyltransferase
VLGSRLTVRPPWEPAGDTAIDLVIDPGRAFGTGAHATTRLCLELMLETAPEGPFVDLGCGSGVLAIGAACLGWGPVLALDYDPAAVEATGENARRNGVEVEVRRFDLRSESAPAAGTVAANLLGPLLLEWAGRAPELPERLIASGLLAHEGDSVAAAFAARGLEERARRAGGEWVALSFERIM